MSGHSKWNNIKNRKGAQDQKKAREFFQVSKMIRVAVRKYADGNPDSNPALRLALEKARQVNMPKENVERAIDRAQGKGAEGQSIQEITYEGYGPGGIGFLVIAATDNVQRTAAELRFIFSRHEGSLSAPGSAAFMFVREEDGFVTTAPILVPPEHLTMIEELYHALEENEDVEEVYTNGEWEGKV